jgi:hypothetical protein
MSMASEYTTRVSGGFRQAGNNVAMSRALLSVGTLIRARGRPALTRRSQTGLFSSSSSLAVKLILALATQSDLRMP